MMTEELPLDSVYAYALSKTLNRVLAPVTVGLYSSCHSRIHMVLKSIESHMMREAQENEHGKHRQSVSDLFKVIIRLLFYQPVDTKGDKSPKGVRYIFVTFSAWHFAGSDMLWAGLVLQLYETFHENFGKFLLILYRAAQYTEPMTRTVSGPGSAEWRSKKICCCPLWFFTLFVLLGILVGFPLLMILFFSQVKDEDMDAQDSNTELHVIQGYVIGIIGLPATYILRYLIHIVKNIMFDLFFKARRMMDNEKVSNQLGFMNEVKKEMEILSCFINFMETFEGKKIRVVLEITHLDRCTPRKIVGVLDAINILLSDEGSPFISILAVNPEVLAKQLNYAKSCLSKEDRAHSFLNRLVTLPFTIPELCDSSKKRVIKTISSGQSKLSDEEILLTPSSGKQSEQCNIPLTERIHPEINLNEKEIENLIESVFQYICDKGNMHKYIVGDTMSIRRIINSVRMSVIIMKTLGHDLTSAKRIAAWVVLANQWPCRLSWILQCIEDDKQNAEINQQSFDTSKTLWQVFSESRVELYMIRERIRSLLEHDGDPELFEMFLKVHFPFTIDNANRLKLSTVNLDHSIQRQLARIRGISSLKDTISQNTPIPLPIKSIINMSVEDVCEELKKLKLPNYGALVQENMLDGRALVYSDNSEIQKMLKMPLGHWTAFAIHFLGVIPPIPSCLIAGEDEPDVVSSKSHIGTCSESSHFHGDTT